jgi:signal transduction histidine kinase
LSVLPRPLYLLAPRGASVDRSWSPDREPIVLHEAAELTGRPPGVLLLHADLPADDVVRALRAAATLPGPWLPVLLEASGAVALPVSLGWPTPLAEVVRWADGAPDASVLELRHVLAWIARARHDVNNPLTSAMAETQLALVDAQEPEIREGLLVIEEQLRRIRDLVASLRVLRPPS